MKQNTFFLHWKQWLRIYDVHSNQTKHSSSVFSLKRAFVSLCCYLQLHCDIYAFRWDTSIFSAAYFYRPVCPFHGNPCTLRPDDIILVPEYITGRLNRVLVGHGSSILMQAIIGYGPLVSVSFPLTTAISLFPLSGQSNMVKPSSKKAMNFTETIHFPDTP